MSLTTITLSVESSNGSYPIYIGTGLLSEPALLSDKIHAKQVCILSDSNAGPYYLQELKQTCMLAGAAHVVSYSIPAGESSKTLQCAENIWSFLLEQHFDRHSVLIALGGGVVGDLTGFCAACYLRGIAVIQYPTSLLGQIDSAIGGKTAINHPLGKNLIGAFHSPKAVIIDILTLNSLSDREFRAALAELIKYAMILDASLYGWLQDHLDALLQRESDAVLYAITRACELKASIVSQDEKETDRRAILNFGHTIGHAIESLLDYKDWCHGEAVSVGMIVATHLSWQQGFIDREVLDSLIAFLNRAKLPTKLPIGITPALILAKIKQDKKHAHRQLQWVLLKQLGEACSGRAVTPEAITEALGFIQ